MIDLTIRGIQQAQQANLRQVAALKPSGAFGQAIQWATSETHRRLTPNTPHDTGALRAARRIQIDRQGLRGRIYTDPSARNPRRGGRPAEYDVKLHQRGEVPGRRSGVLASMAYTVRTEGPRIGRGALAILRRGLG